MKSCDVSQIQWDYHLKSKKSLKRDDMRHSSQFKPNWKNLDICLHLSISNISVLHTVIFQWYLCGWHMTWEQIHPSALLDWRIWAVTGLLTLLWLICFELNVFFEEWTVSFIRDKHCHLALKLTDGDFSIKYIYIFFISSSPGGRHFKCTLTNHPRK